MKRWVTVVTTALALAPVAANAQKPTANMHTRSAEVYLNTAKRQTVQADRVAEFQKALEAALKGTANDPNNPLPWFQVGQAYVGIGDYIGADSAFDRAEKMYPDYAKETEPIRQQGWISLYNAGVTALQTNNVAEAVKNLQAADNLYSKRPEAMVTLGSLYLQTGDFAKGEQTLRKAMAFLATGDRSKLKPDQLKAWEEDELNVALRLANMYADQKRNDEAEKVYRDLLKGQPNNTMAAANLATVLTRGGKNAEALTVYRDLLKRTDLSEATLLKAGVGLFTAADFVASADAFRRAAAINPYSHATLYNLAQSLFAITSDLENQKKTTPARKAELDVQLVKLYEEMRVTSEKLAGIDPTGRNVLMMLAQSQRSLGDLATGAATDEWKKKALATLEKHKAMVVEVGDISVLPTATEADISGKLTNLLATPGTPIKLRLTVINIEGADLVTEEFTIPAPAKDASVTFERKIKVPAGAVGWKYTIVS